MIEYKGLTTQQLSYRKLALCNLAVLLQRPHAYQAYDLYELDRLFLVFALGYEQHLWPLAM